MLLNTLRIYQNCCYKAGDTTPLPVQGAGTAGRAGSHLLEQQEEREEEEKFIQQIYDQILTSCHYHN